MQRQVLEQLFITDPKVAFGHASLLWIWHGDLSNIIQCHLNSWLRTTSYITHKTLSLSLVLILLALPTFCSHLYKPYLTLIHLWSPDLMKVVINLFSQFITDFTNYVDEFLIFFALSCTALALHYWITLWGTECCWSHLLDFVPTLEAAIITGTIPVFGRFVAGKNLMDTYTSGQKFSSNWLALPGSMMTMLSCWRSLSSLL